MENEIDMEVLNPGIEETTTQDESTDSGTNNHFTDRERQLYARLKREQERNKELEGLVSQPSDTQRPTGAFEERLELIAKGYQDEEIDFIQKNGGKKALNDEFVLSALKARKDKIEANAKAVSGVSSKSGVSMQFTEGQIAKMSAQEYQEKILRQ